MECINQEKIGKTFNVPEPFSIFGKNPDTAPDTPCPGRLDRHTGDISKWRLDDTDRDKRELIDPVFLVLHIPELSFQSKIYAYPKTKFLVE
jgi:hypothetical protein